MQLRPAELTSLLDFKLFFFFSLLIYHTAGLQTHPSLRMLHHSSPIRQERGQPGWSHTHTATLTQ